MNFESPTFETEPSIEKMKERVEQGIESAMSLIRERFELSEDRDSNLEFHNSEHTQTVIDRVEKILKTIQDAQRDSGDTNIITEKEIQLALLAASFHDVVQDWSEARNEDDDKIMRKRNIKLNEESSYAEAEAFMKSVNESEHVFSDDDMKVVEKAILVTIPGFSPEDKTVVQPNLSEESSLVELALALADIGSAGMGGPDDFLKDGIALFKEENLDITRNLNSLGIEGLSEGQKEEYKNRMIKWFDSQPDFARGRKKLLEDEVERLKSNFPREVVLNLFDKFEESIEAAENFATSLKNESFEEIILKMSY